MCARSSSVDKVNRASTVAVCQSNYQQRTTALASVNLRTQCNAKAHTIVLPQQGAHVVCSRAPCSCSCSPAAAVAAAAVAGLGNAKARVLPHVNYRQLQPPEPLCIHYFTLKDADQVFLCILSFYMRQQWNEKNAASCGGQKILQHLFV